MKTFLQPTIFIDHESPDSKRHAGRTLWIMLIIVASVCCFPVFSQVASSQKINPVTKKATPNCKEDEPSIKIRQAASQTLKASSNDIWFEKNDGQFGNSEVLYGFRTSFGSMGVYENKLRVVTEQTENGKKAGRQIVDISFPGSLQNWAVVPGKSADVKGSYNTKCGTIQALIYHEITLKNVYAGIDLRLYAGENGALEFDWLVARAIDHEKIRMNFTGQDGISVEKNGDILIDLLHNDMRIVIPETYQVINGSKKFFAAKMCTSDDKGTLKYDIAGNMDPNLPLVIDPVMIWSTYLHNNTATFDEYLYTIAVNTASEVYACGVTNEAISIPYMSGIAPGFFKHLQFCTQFRRCRAIGDFVPVKPFWDRYHSLDIYRHDNQYPRGIGHFSG